MESIKTLSDLVNVMRETPRRTYDFISNNNHLLDKAEVVDVVKELLYAIHSFCTEDQAAEMLNMVADELEYLYKEDLEKI